MSDSPNEGARSYNQRALWFASKLDPTAYNLAYGFQLREGLDEEALLQHLYADAARPYELQHGPILRCALHGRGPGEHVLLLATHHLSLDGSSVLLLLQDLQRLYGALAQGLESVSEPAGHQGYDAFVRWQSEWLASAEADRARQRRGGPGT